MKSLTHAFRLSALAAASYFVFLIFAFGQDPVNVPPGVPMVPEVDPLSQMLMLFRDFKSLSPIAIGVTLVMTITQAIKHYFKEFKYKRLLVTGLSLSYGLLISLQQGLHIFDAAILIMITGGGAVALYEAFKGTVNTVVKK